MTVDFEYQEILNLLGAIELGIITGLVDEDDIGPVRRKLWVTEKSFNDEERDDE